VARDPRVQGIVSNLPIIDFGLWQFITSDGVIMRILAGWMERSATRHGPGYNQYEYDLVVCFPFAF
jgi:hypothetical protein